ncbi:hypothetical protein [Azospirillum argentinense]|uniref:hypothetical protein n=1 Tax=Azospirillum argentinense TaxID=2970906 RepID=UPI0032DE4A13
MQLPLATLTYDAVVAAARQAHAEGRLGYQDRLRRRSGACNYRYTGGSCCAIGAALPDDVAELCDDLDRLSDQGVLAASSTVGDLIRAGVFAVPAVDRPRLNTLQGLHDRCMDGTAEDIAAFETALGVGGAS